MTRKDCIWRTRTRGPKRSPEKKRETNLELFRIIAMFLIISHHYVVNSEIRTLINTDNSLGRSLFLLLFGAYGKPGLNCFVLITGYFMCRSSITAKKFAKLFLEVMFYRLIINGIFWISGYEAFSVPVLLKALLPVSSLGTGFTNAYLLFFLCIPFINVLIQNMTQKQHFYLLLLMSTIYILMGTVKFLFSLTMNYLSWYVVLYLFASYVRIYPNKCFESRRIWGWTALGLLIVSMLSVMACAWVDKSLAYYFLTDANTFLAFALGFSAFMFFKNTKIKYTRWINTLAATCFGVLQIHANSVTMRRWLWQDVLNNTGIYHEVWMPVHAVLSVLCIFLVCAGIDLLRIQFVEKPFFKWWDRHWPKVMKAFKKAESFLFKKLGVSKE